MSTREVTAERPDSVLHPTGWDHVTLMGSNADEAVAFYRDVLGLPVERYALTDAPTGRDF